MIGTVVRVQVPLLITFNEDHVEFVVTALADALEHSYQIIDFFEEKEDYDF